MVIWVIFVVQKGITLTPQVGNFELLKIERGKLTWSKNLNVRISKIGSYNIVVFLTICISYANNCFTL